MDYFPKITATIALIMALLLPSMSNAQYSLVVANGTSTSSNVPIRGYYCDQYLRAQFVYPATDIEIMSGGTISQMTFFSTRNNCSWANTDFRVYIKEISETIISSYENSSTMTLVYSGPLSVADSHLIITFTAPYIYTGGNLLIEVANVAKGSYSSCSFYGINSIGSCIQGNNSSSINSVPANQGNFLPKVQFDFSNNNLNNDGDFIYSDATKHKLLQYTGLGGDVTIASTVDTIAAYAFQGCSGLTSVTIPNSVTSIGSYAFNGCSGLTSVTIPNSVTYIGDYAFENCSGLTSVTIPNSLTSIEIGAFHGCSGLTSVTIPNSVTSIGSSAFSGCSGLTSVTIPNSVTSIGDDAFWGCVGLTAVSIPDSVTSIGASAFRDCSGLTSVTIGSSMRSIGNSAFAGCSGLTSFIIPNSITSIGDYAFNGCSGLTSVTIPDSVTTIGYSAFSDCSGLISVVFNATSCSSMGNYFNPVFSGCSGVANLTIGENVTIIPEYAFRGLTGLTSVTIPNSVTSIGDHAFDNCSGLTSVTFGRSVSSIGSNAFNNCTGLTSVIIPESVTNIGYNAFYGCSGLTSVTIPNSVTSIGSSAFSGCSNLTELWLKPTIPPTLGSASSLGANSVTLVVPNNSYNAYTSAGTYYTNHPIYRDSIIVTAFVNDTIMGYVTGGDAILIYPYQNDTITLIATANYGYHFVRWDDNSTDNPLIIVTDSNITRTAIFERNQYHILATSDTVTHGKINISSQVWGDGDFNVVDLSREYLKQITLTAKPNHGYHFTHWQDGDTNNPRTFILTQDTSFVAYYDKNTYTLSFQSADTNKGIVNTVSVTGEYLDTTMLIYATALPHYHFDHWDWGCWYCNSTENPRRFVIDDNRTYTAYFSIDVHTVNVQIDNIAHGTVDGSGSREYGQPITVSATPYSGYQFSHWSDGSTYNPYTFAVLEDKNLTAVFIADGEPWQDTVVVYDTLYVDVPYTVHDTTYIDVPYAVHDTTYINVHDTTTVIDTVTHYIYDTTIVHDTTLVTDTLWLTQYDTIWLHDTIIIHDTLVVGADEVDALNAKIYTSHGQIVVEGTEDNTVWLYDINGRILATKQDEYSALRFDVPASGTYLIKVGHHPARKVVVIR